ncbi:hypothetical protein F4703DRAFT_1918608 [Phycomyces blakesleeanus]|uniref:Uncharacterized protein n=1 Tax=Phycomyces blakesleeanus (strain ATCC 8743b / DSM 1359 / FGSC 10004 / NBRC 33097 / NRRL 1555) TaxID=763407 RepID=A0A162U258_PHYB8|nr:hypothetical protein PHYBLDRAFT_169141 [Phycomyces blakesleeanus NRRL 1555(-)]OAD72882.1 hypothetical protein PHYBLDRAFT_169141 [Phycomyces blakesleeanus NRRL 1555(-)]|eukprot:XP_018290922.1 hypothetical protein PHYBLDRAFT_169141 [Phycomyces blakesleeanus NRRL 1555(-)]
MRIRKQNHLCALYIPKANVRATERLKNTAPNLSVCQYSPSNDCAVCFHQVQLSENNKCRQPKEYGFQRKHKKKSEKCRGSIMFNGRTDKPSPLPSSIFILVLIFFFMIMIMLVLTAFIIKPSKDALRTHFDGGTNLKAH